MLSVFDALRKNRITVRKPNGQVFEDIKATVTPNMINFDHQGGLILEVDDVIETQLSNGSKDTYLVLDPCFHEGLSAIRPHYQARVQKIGVKEAQKHIENLTINVSGPNARVNSNSTDSSLNFISGSNDIGELIEGLRASIQGMNIDPASKSDALEIADEIESQANAADPNKTVIKTLLGALPASGNIASIVSAIATILSL